MDGPLKLSPEDFPSAPSRLDTAVDARYSPEPSYVDVRGAPVPARQAEGTAEDMSRQLLSHPDLLTAARRAVLGLMRLGPGGRVRHERDLADAVFSTITRTERLSGSRNRV